LLMRRGHPAHLLPKPRPDENASGALMRPFAALEKPMRFIGGTGASREERLPSGYTLEHSDPDVLVLRGPHGRVVARFSARGAAAEAIEQEARMHYRERNRSA
jgi:hypothetical protein